MREAGSQRPCSKDRDPRSPLPVPRPSPGATRDAISGLLSIVSPFQAVCPQLRGQSGVAKTKTRSCRSPARNPSMASYSLQSERHSLVYQTPGDLTLVCCFTPLLPSFLDLSPPSSLDLFVIVTSCALLKASVPFHYCSLRLGCSSLRLAAPLHSSDPSVSITPSSCLSNLTSL